MNAERSAHSAMHLQAVGRVATSFAQMELTTFVAVATSARVDLDRAQILIGGQPFDRLADLLVSLTAHNRPGSEELEKVRQWRGQARDVARRRNAVLHAAWLSGDHDPLVSIRFGRTATGGIPSSEWTLEELAELANSIEALLSELTGLLRPLGLLDPRQD